MWIHQSPSVPSRTAELQAGNTRVAILSSALKGEEEYGAVPSHLIAFATAKLRGVSARARADSMHFGSVSRSSRGAALLCFSEASERCAAAVLLLAFFFLSSFDRGLTS